MVRLRVEHTRLVTVWSRSVVESAKLRLRHCGRLYGPGSTRLEGLALQRAWLDDEEGSIRFQHTKSGAQTRIIGRSAAELLLAQPNTGSPFFFPADWGDGHFIGVVRVFDRVCAMAQLKDVTPHTLRHTFASVAADMGFSELTIAALLGHASRPSRSRSRV